MPVGLCVFGVAEFLPCCDFPGQSVLVGDTPGEALGCQHAEFALRHVQATAVLGRVVPFEPFDEAACLLGGEGFIERGGFVGV